MARFGLSLVSLFLGSIAHAYNDFPLDCAGQNGDTKEECQQPLKPVTAVVLGSFYVATLPCPGCAVRFDNGVLQQRKNDLFFNISVSYDNRTLLLNQMPVFPSLATNPHPPGILAPQVAPEFTRADLDNTIQCSREPCASGDGQCWCMNRAVSASYMSQVDLDYDYYSHWLESHPETQTEKWEITFDAIGGHDGLHSDPIWQANGSGDATYYTLRIVVQGREIEGERYAGEKDLQAGSSLFGMIEASEIVYEYEIASVDITERSFKIPAPKSGLRASLRRFFGLDITEKNGHTIYQLSEWGQYGKKGSLRQHLGVFIHDWPWDIVGIILGGAVASMLGIWFACKLFWVVKEQRELARWDGMDTVWEHIRRDGGDEEQAQLLDGVYRDEPDEDSPPPRYTDEVQTNKPLPSKPLPEKPLPAVPLIDA
ncbi:hypothetical protein K458DRAFT_382200 [Lentithecium fluviatile CBS 122367]|uniref:Uncharacterized protein n=1 Tax=Lentithecium fluviatile CBS 122367 TaxID=1168545 RepID=A0A6G1JJ91_9PLEO|nr:hypothetical protein K458DRAFT_382200 [Lentithecium fluviatile CBS 122367]